MPCYLVYNYYMINYYCFVFVISTPITENWVCLHPQSLFHSQSTSHLVLPECTMVLCDICLMVPKMNHSLLPSLVKQILTSLGGTWICLYWVTLNREPPWRHRRVWCHKSSLDWEPFSQMGTICVLFLATSKNEQWMKLIFNNYG